MDLIEEIKEKLRQQGIFAWIANAIWEILAIFFIAALPTASYVLGQGIPPTRLFSTSLWAVNVTMGLIVAMTVGAVASLLLEAIKLFRGSDHGTSKRSKGKVAFDGFAAVFHVVYCGILMVAFAVFVSTFTWPTRLVLALWIASALAVFILHFVRVVGGEEQSVKEPLPIAFRAHLCFLICGIAMTAASLHLGPVGSSLLGTTHLGGGLPVQFITDASTIRTGSLILEASDGWFVREQSKCDQLIFISADKFSEQVWLNKDTQPVCQTESSYVRLPKSVGP